jgi:putative mRNA 3-end processing factor
MVFDSDPLIVATRRGLYCPQGDFYIDPWRPVQTAVITHGHGDHLRQGNARYILARPGLGIARARLRGNHDVHAVDYGARHALGSTTISLHPAGHILGSAQVRIEHGGQVWVVSGDYKRQPDPTCAPFEPLQSDVFVSEATFALPQYRWPPAQEVVRQILDWWRANRERGLASMLFCYALGKAQRLLAELAALDSEPVHVHGAMTTLIEVYRTAGVEMVATTPVPRPSRTEFRGALILAPPSARRSSWARGFGTVATGFCSGWMCVTGGPNQSSLDRGFVLSDHADWGDLVMTCEQTGARRIFLTHGDAQALIEHLGVRGIEAFPL